MNKDMWRVAMAAVQVAIAEEERSVLAQALRKDDSDSMLTNEGVAALIATMAAVAEKGQFVPTLWAAAASRQMWQQRKQLREEAAMWLTGPMPAHHLNETLFTETVHVAYRLVQLTACAQGIRTWQEEIAELKDHSVDLIPEGIVPESDKKEAAAGKYLLLCMETAQYWVNEQGSVRRLLEMTSRYGIATPCLAAALSEFDALRRTEKA